MPLVDFIDIVQKMKSGIQKALTEIEKPVYTKLITYRWIKENGFCLKIWSTLSQFSVGYSSVIS